ncbi:hypothetical protein ACL02U_15990 [Streptomyces sp. MS06]|uniref:hypothetical protein n=1 Tax=Streptomyces sp. MS06 TaxID=3385974 RepID=UPI00399F981F
MLRITDDRTGQNVEAAPLRRGLTRVEAHDPGLDPTALRVLLVTDLLVRALELEGTPVWTVFTGDRQQAELRTDAAALGVRPLEDGRGLGAALGEAQTVHVAERGTRVPDGVLVGVAPVEPAPGPPARSALPAHTDPSAVRLALLAAPRGAPLRLDPPALTGARDTLTRWRRAVAGWARSPSRPVPDTVRGRLRAAWEDDLDVPAVLDTLRSVEQAGPELPDGARFETYAYADRLLGLELTRDLGTPP